MSLLSLWSNRINTANSRKHQEFAGRLNSVNNRAELYQHLKEENGFVFIIVEISFVNCLIVSLEKQTLLVCCGQQFFYYL